MVAITKERRHRTEIIANRAQREGTEMPSEKFINNKFAEQLEINKPLQEIKEAQ